MKDGYIKSLDGVRAVAIILVMSYHAGLNFFGWMGVQLFFVLSGFLITGILWKEKTKEDPVPQKLKRFWVRRSLRIFPVYFAYLIVLGILFLVVTFPSYYPLYAPYLFTYTFNYTRLLAGWQGNPLFTHLWSLSIEEQFYIFFPLLVFLLPRKAVRGLLVVMVLLAPLIRFLLGEYYSARTTAYVASDAVYWNTLSHLDAFFLGGLIPVFDLDKKIRKPFRWLGLAFGIVVAAGIIHYITSGPTIAYWRDLGYNHEVVKNYSHVWKYSALNFLFAAFILCLVKAAASGNVFQRCFENKLLVQIGRVSYGMYLFHWAILVYLVQRIYHPENLALQFLIFVPYVVITYIAAWLSYSFFESKFLRLKERFYPKKGKGRGPVAPVELPSESISPHSK